MKSKSAEKIKLTSYDDLFGSSEVTAGEKVVSVPIRLFHTFKDHPFRVLDDEKMQETVESVKRYGILMPGIVRPYGDGEYEMVAGHRRWRACELAGMEEMPVIIREMDDDTATVIMVDTNIQREDILPSEKAHAYKMKYEAMKHQGSKANKGSSGVDGVKIEDVEAMGIEKYLSEIKSELMNGKYKPSPVKRVMIPKPDGSERPLGIPTVKDRIVQMAAKIAIEPVFEADFRDCSYGFRPKRSARQALEVVRKACNNKGYYVVDADIEKFFDNVNQDKLMKLAEQRISDRRILKLIRQWLVSGVLYGNVLTISELGTSQGSVISPLLANIYLNTLDRLWEKYGHTHGILVRYADDTVIICKNKKSANHALNLLQYIMVKLDLKLHPVKTKIVSMWDGKEGFDFLGMHHRRMTTETRKGQLYKETYQYPNRKAMKKMKAEVKRNVNRRSLLVAKEEDLIKNLNPKITGWKNYYSTKRNEKWMQALDWYIICTFTRWYNKKHQRRNRMSKVGFVRNSIYEKGLKKMARA